MNTRVSVSLLRTASSCALAAAISFGGLAQAQDSVNLPSMGDPADQIMSPAQEKALGDAFMRQVRERLNIVEDPLLNTYIQALGAHLVNAAEHPGTTFTFFIVQDDMINAFAAPGGYIGVNSGLILATGNESQLAGVMAHEIAHVTQRHIARAYAAAKDSSLPTAAAILAAILLGGENRQASQAALATGLATSQQLRLNYTRANEYEADRLGIRILAQAQFSPQGMVDFFRVLQRSHASNSLNRPEYLSTHPLSNNRVAEAQSRVASLAAPQQRDDSRSFRLAQRRLKVISATDRAKLMASGKQQLKRSRGVEREPLVYEVALLAHVASNHAMAEDLTRELIDVAPDNLFYGVLRAQHAFATGRTEESDDLLDQLLDLYPGNLAVLMTQADTSEKQGNLATAASALREALAVSRTNQPLIYRTLARIEDRRNNAVASLEALAEYHVLSGNMGLAIRQLEQALKRTDEGTAGSLRVAARLQQLRDDLGNQLRNRRGG